MGSTAPSPTTSSRRRPRRGRRASEPGDRARGDVIPADRFEAHRAHLRAAAYRMLGSQAEADDAVQEVPLRHRRHREPATGSAPEHEARRHPGRGAARGPRDAQPRRAARVRAPRHVRGAFDEIGAIVGRSPNAAKQLVRMGSPEEVRGAAAVAGTFSGRALAAQSALIDGGVGVVWAVGGRPKVAWDFTITDGKIVHIDMLAAPESLDDLDLTILE